jgi:cell division protease FtsH
LNIAEEDRYLRSKPELLDYLKVLLGGFVAEQLVFDRTTTGAADDLKRVVETSRAMIEDYGMGSQLFLASGSGSEALTSQAALHRRDEEQQGLVDQAQFEARMLIMDNRALLDQLAEALLSKETLDRSEIEHILTHGSVEEIDEPDAIEEPEAALEPQPAEEPEAEAAPAAETNESPGNGSIAPPTPRQSMPPPAEARI